MPDTEKTAFVAGAGPRLGGALATLLAGNGYRVVILARSEDALVKAGVEDMPTVSAHQCDLTNARMTADVLDSLIGEGGTPDVGIYNAGAIHIGGFAETDPEVFRRMWEVNCLGAVHFANGLLPAMEAAGKGTMIFSGATASVKGGPGSRLLHPPNSPCVASPSRWPGSMVRRVCILLTRSSTG